MEAGEEAAVAAGGVGAARGTATDAAAARTSAGPLSA